MSVVIGIETSQDLCSAAVCEQGVMVAQESRAMQRLHNEQVLAVVDAAMTAAFGASMPPRRPDAVGFGCGPGSFTGVRIAAAVAQAIAFGARARVVPVSSTLALAHAALDLTRRPDAAIAGASLAPSSLPAGEPPGVVTVIPSRRDACYVASFRIERGNPTPRLADVLWDGPGAWDDLARFADPGWWVVGNAPSWLARVRPELVYVADVRTSGATIATLASAAFVSGGGLPPEQGLPVYVHGDSPWRPIRPVIDG